MRTFWIPAPQQVRVALNKRYQWGVPKSGLLQRRGQMKMSEPVCNYCTRLAKRPEHEWGELFEAIIAALYTEFLRPGDTCVDGGAHCGRHTIPMARIVGPAGKLHAYEPITEVVKLLLDSINRENMQDRIEVHSCALAEKTGLREFTSFYDAEEPWRAAYSGLRKGWAPGEFKSLTITTSVTTLDYSLATVQNLKFIKLDLEGGEYHALLGGETVIGSNRPLIAFEHVRSGSGSLYGYGVDEFFGFFKRIDYEVCDILADELTAENWQWNRSMPWYCIGSPREMNWQDKISHCINTLLVE